MALSQIKTMKKENYQWAAKTVCPLGSDDDDTKIMTRKKN